MNIAINITPSYESHAITVIDRLFDLGDYVDTLIVFTTHSYSWPLLNDLSVQHKFILEICIVDSLSNYRIHGRFDPIIYGRLFLSEIYSVNKILYLDVDVWPVQSLSKLWNFYTNSIVYAVSDIQSERRLRSLQRLGYSISGDYFNAGVILFNDLDAVRDRFYCMQKLIGRDLKYHDQDILNIYLYDVVELLPTRFNYMYFKGSSDIVLVHFCHSKPWQTPNFHPFSLEYYQVWSKFNDRYIPVKLGLFRRLQLFVMKHLERL